MTRTTKAKAVNTARLFNAPKYTPSTALLCSLTFTALAGQAVAAEKNVADSEATKLAPIEVVDGKLGATTEGTGSYTTGSSDTSTRLALSLRDTPQSVSVVGVQQMEDHNLTTLLDVIEQTPGIVTDRVDERVRFTSRGFNLNYMMEGIPTYAFRSVSGEASMVSTAIYDRVEIVRGSSGLLNGVGAPGGSINLVRKRPTEQFAGSISAGVGSWNNYSTEVDLGGAINDAGTVRGRVVASVADGDSYIDHRETAENVFYGIVEADISENTMLTGGFEYQTTDTDGANFGQAPLFFADGTRTNLPDSFNSSLPWSKWDMTTRRLFVGVDHQFDNDWKLKVNSSLTKSNRDRWSGDVWLYPSDVDPVTGNSTMRLASNPADGINKSVDAYATGPFDFLGREHQAAFGVSLSRYDFDYQTDGAVAGAFDSRTISIYDTGSVAKPDSFSNPLNMTDGDILEHAIYGSAEFNITDPLSVILGGRFTWYDHEQSFRMWTFGANGAVVSSSAIDENAVFTPYVGVTYELTPEYSVYASYTDIFEPNTQLDANSSVLDPKRGTSMELGIKGEHRDGKLNTSFAIFEAEEDNVAVVDTSVGTLPDGSTAYRAEKGARSRGFELTVAGEVLPNWQVMGGYTYHSKRDSDGNILDTTKPRRLLRLATSYRLPGDLNKLTIGGSVSYQDSISYNELYGLGTVEQDSVTVWGLMARYDFTSQLSATLNVENVTDKDYYSGLGGYNGYTQADPRNVWLKVNYDF